MTRPFDKPSTSYEEQVLILKNRGMQIDDELSAVFYLEHVNYYRLCAYWLPFEADHQTREFKPGTKFEDILDLYVFDRELRLLLLDAIERVEISVRSHWAYEMAHKHGTHSHLEQNLATNKEYWEKNKKDLLREISRSDEAFIKHLKQSYQEESPPIWAVCEVMSIGLLSKWLSNLKPESTRKSIAKAFSLGESTLISWLSHLTIVRNLSAHHARLWDREFIRKPEEIQTKPAILVGEFVPGSVRLYNTLVILLCLMDVIAPKHHWRQRLREFLLKHQKNLQTMSFPPDWDKKQIWQEDQTPKSPERGLKHTSSKAPSQGGVLGR